jgi:tetratricopeptide (TPR) repeat protein
LQSDANSEEFLKQLLTAFCVVLLARWSVADQRTGGVALQKAIEAFNQGKIEQAAKLVDTAAKADSKKPEIPNLRGAIFIRQKRYEDAAEQFSQALALDPKFYPAKLNLATVKLLQGDYTGATNEYEALKLLDPDSELVDFQLVLCTLLGGDPSKASRMVDLMKFPGKTPAYYYARAAIALKKGEKAAAQKYLENARKYYSEEKCRYFGQLLKEMDLNLTASTPSEKTPDPHAGSRGSDTGSH